MSNITSNTRQIAFNHVVGKNSGRQETHIGSVTGTQILNQSSEYDLPIKAEGMAAKVSASANESESPQSKHHLGESSAPGAQRPALDARLSICAPNQI